MFKILFGAALGIVLLELSRNSKLNEARRTRIDWYPTPGNYGQLTSAQARVYLEDLRK